MVTLIKTTKTITKRKTNIYELRGQDLLKFIKETNICGIVAKNSKVSLQIELPSTGLINVEDNTKFFVTIDREETKKDNNPLE